MNDLDLKYRYFIDKMVDENFSEKPQLDRNIDSIVENLIDNIGPRIFIEELATKRTSFIETCAAVGVVMSASLMKDITEFIGFVQRISKSLHTPMSDKQIQILAEKGDVYKKLANKVLKGTLSTLNKNYDWDSDGKSQCLKLTSDLNDVDGVVDLCAIARGMYKFVQTIAVGKSKMGPKLFFIHSKIDMYYKTEEEVLGKIEGSKNNTADIIISTLPADKTMQAMRKGMPQPNKGQNPTWVEVKQGKQIVCKYIQASLKISETGGQLGKVGDKMTAMGLKPVLAGQARDIVAGESAYQMMNDMDVFYEYSIKQLWNNAKSIFGDIWDKLKSAVGKVSKWFVGKWGSILRKDIPPAIMINDFAKECGVTSFRESEIQEMINSNILLEGQMNPATIKYVKKIQERGPAAIKIVNKEKKSLQQMLKNQPKSIIGSIGSDLKAQTFKWSKGIVLAKGQVRKGETSKQAYGRIQVLHLVGNYCTFKTLQSMVQDSHKVIQVVRSLTAEMIFGGTKLPLYKVFGDYDNSAKPWHWMGTVDHFVKQGQDLSKQNIQILGIKVSSHQDHYVIYVHMLLELEDEKKCYALFRTGPNSSSSFTYNFEGQSKYCIAPGDNLDLGREK